MHYLLPYELSSQHSAPHPSPPFFPPWDLSLKSFWRNTLCLQIPAVRCLLLWAVLRLEILPCSWCMRPAAHPLHPGLIQVRMFYKNSSILSTLQTQCTITICSFWRSMEPIAPTAGSIKHIHAFLCHTDGVSCIVVTSSFSRCRKPEILHRYEQMCSRQVAQGCGMYQSTWAGCILCSAQPLLHSRGAECCYQKAESVLFYLII